MPYGFCSEFDIKSYYHLSAALNKYPKPSRLFFTFLFLSVDVKCLRSDQDGLTGHLTMYST